LGGASRKSEGKNVRSFQNGVLVKARPFVTNMWVMLFRFQLFGAICERFEERVESPRIDRFLRCLILEPGRDVLRVTARFLEWDLPVTPLHTQACVLEDVGKPEIAPLEGPLVFVLSVEASWRVLSFVFESEVLAMMSGFGHGWRAYRATQRHRMVRAMEVVGIQEWPESEDEEDQGFQGGDQAVAAETPPPQKKRAKRGRGS